MVEKFQIKDEFMMNDGKVIVFGGGFRQILPVCGNFFISKKCTFTDLNKKLYKMYIYYRSYSLFNRKRR